MRVLFVNHTALVSGAELAMLELAQGLAPEVSCLLACPRGRLAELARERGLFVEEVPGTEGSLRLHPVHTPVAVAQLARLALATRRIARRQRVDLIDAASIRAGLACALAAQMGAPPVAVHVQDVLPAGPVSRATVEVLGRGTAALIASSRYTASGVAPWPARVVPLPIDLARFDPDRVDAQRARRGNGLPASSSVLAVVGQITPWKGQDLAIRTLAALVRRGVDAHLLLVGTTTFKSRATRFDNVAYERELHALAGELGVSERVRFMGHRDDISELLAATDLLLMVSRGEPFGRVVVEAMAMGVPVLAGDEGGPRETIRHGQDGLLLATRDPEEWAATTASLLGRPRERARMGANGRRRAADYGVERYARAVWQVFAEVLCT